MTDQARAEAEADALIYVDMLRRELPLDDEDQEILKACYLAGRAAGRAECIEALEEAPFLPSGHGAPVRVIRALDAAPSGCAECGGTGVVAHTPGLGSEGTVPCPECGPSGEGE